MENNLILSKLATYCSPGNIFSILLDGTGDMVNNWAYSMCLNNRELITLYYSVLVILPKSIEKLIDAPRASQSALYCIKQVFYVPLYCHPVATRWKRVLLRMKQEPFDSVDCILIIFKKVDGAKTWKLEV